MPIAEVNGQKLYYEDTGGSGPAVIFLATVFSWTTRCSPRRSTR